MSPDVPTIAELDRRFAEWVFRSSAHLEKLVFGIAPELKQLRERIETEPVAPLGQLRDDGGSIVASCQACDDPTAMYIGEMASAVGAQLAYIAGEQMAFRELSAALLGVDVSPVSEVALAKLRSQVGDLADDVLGSSSRDDVLAWESGDLRGPSKLGAVKSLLDEIPDAMQ